MQSIISRFTALALMTVAMSAVAEGGEGAAPAKPQTLAEKLTAKAQALATKINAQTEEYNAILEQLKAIELVSSVKQGDTVTATSGKGEKAVTVTGVVLGVAEDETGKKIKVQSGTGFDTAVFVFHPGQIVSVVPYVEPVADEEVVEQPAETAEFDAQHS